MASIVWVKPSCLRDTAELICFLVFSSAVLRHAAAFQCFSPCRSIPVLSDPSRRDRCGTQHFSALRNRANPASSRTRVHTVSSSGAWNCNDALHLNLPCHALAPLQKRRHPLLALHAQESSPSSVATPYSALVSWLMEAGGHVHSAVQLTEDDAGAGRGLVSAQAVARGEQLIVVPRKAQLFFTPDGADQQANLLQVIKTVNPHIRGMQLAVKLVQEKLKASDSAFQTYLSTLPESYDQLPLYYVDDIPELQFPSVEQQAVERLTELIRLSQTCAACAGTGTDPFAAGVDIGVLLWAACTTSSRAFRPTELFNKARSNPPGANTGGGGHLEVLLPVVDLMNHCSDSNCCLSDASSLAGPLAVAVTATRDIRRGESLRLDYGPLTNADMVVNYGFVEEANPHDKVLLPAGALSYALQASVESFQRLLALKETDDFLSPHEAKLLSEAQLRLLQHANLTNKQTLVVTHEGELEAAGMALVRALVLRSPQEAQGIADLFLPLPDADLEARARDVVRRLCEIALKQVPTSLAHDLKLLSGNLQLEAQAASYAGLDYASSPQAPGQPGDNGANAGEGQPLIRVEGGGGDKAGGSGVGQGQVIEWEGKTKEELGAAVSAVEYRIAHKQILTRAMQVYS